MTKDHHPISCTEPHSIDSQNHSLAWAGRDLKDYRTIEPRNSWFRRDVKAHPTWPRAPPGMWHPQLSGHLPQCSAAGMGCQPHNTPTHQNTCGLESPCATTIGFALLHPPAPKRAPSSVQPNPAQRGRINLNSLVAISIAMPASPSSGVLQNVWSLWISKTMYRWSRGWGAAQLPQHGHRQEHQVLLII